MTDADDVVHSTYGPYPSLLRDVLAALAAGGHDDALRIAWGQGHHGWSAPLCDLLCAGKGIQAKAMVLAMLAGFPLEEGLSSCPRCASTTAPRRCVHDVTGLLDDDDDGDDDLSRRDDCDDERSRDYTVDLTCMACGHNSGSAHGFSVAEASDEARRWWNTWGEEDVPAGGEGH